MNSNRSLNKKFVIPAKAGIQLIKGLPRGGTTSIFDPLRGQLKLLDSGIRGNDIVNILFNAHPVHRTRGFTLLELLVVMVIAGIILGMVSFKAMPDDRQVLQQDAQRIALLLQLAREEAIVRDRPIAFEADSNQYRFLIREEQVWQVLQPDEMLRERDFKHSPVSFTMVPDAPTTPLHITFGREPVDKPFLLTLTVGEAHVAIRADGIGHFEVE